VLARRIESTLKIKSATRETVMTCARQDFYTPSHCNCWSEYDFYTNVLCVADDSTPLLCSTPITKNVKDVNPHLACVNSSFIL